MVHNQLSEGAIDLTKATHPHGCLILCSRYDDLGVTQAAAIDVQGEGPCTEQDISAAPQVNGVYGEVKETIDKQENLKADKQNMLSKGIGVSLIKGDVVSPKRGLQGLSE